MDRVLSLPELLENIFWYMDNACNANNALVCQQWHGVSLDVVWHTIDNLYHLFNALSPLQSPRNDPNTYGFTRQLLPSDWKGFERYSRRVRHLVLHDGVEGYKGALEEVARTATTVGILPNLRHLEWTNLTSPAMAIYSTLFMQKYVTHFAVQLPEGIIEDDPQYFEHIGARMPSLSLFNWRVITPMRDIEDAVLKVIGRLPKLTQVVLPSYHLTSRIAQQMSKLGHLESILIDNTEDSWGDPVDLSVFKPVLSDGAFPSLIILDMSASLADLAQFVKKCPSIVFLSIRPPSWESSDNIRYLFDVLSDNSKNLTLLALDIDDGNSDDPITIDTLRPLFKCAKLACFRTTHAYPLHLVPDDIEELASNWSHLERLHLNPSPSFFTHADPQLTLHALLPFAQHCPYLRSLGLFIDASKTDLPLGAMEYLQHLTKFNVGLSQITDPDPVAIHLIQTCPSLKKITYDDFTWVGETLAVAVKEEGSRRAGKWEEVNHLLLTPTMRGR